MCNVPTSTHSLHWQVLQCAYFPMLNSALAPLPLAAFHSHTPRWLLEARDLHISTMPVLVYLDDLFNAAAISAPGDDDFNLAWKNVRFGFETPFNIGSCVSPVKGHSCQVVGLLISQFSARKWVCSDARAQSFCERGAGSLFQGVLQPAWDFSNKDAFWIQSGYSIFCFVGTSTFFFFIITTFFYANSSPTLRPT